MEAELLKRPRNPHLLTFPCKGQNWEQLRVAKFYCLAMFLWTPSSLGVLTGRRNIQLLVIPLVAFAVIGWTLYAHKDHFVTYYSVQMGRYVHNELYKTNSQITVSDGKFFFLPCFISMTLMLRARI